ncbi:Serine/threonine protein phosphatase 2A 57 kDa regulatory subunit B' alpha isoform [Astathelohania contejeani]|uniref:Serine/threonine protein phosphatase 2A 57 kDa regulatory subunit B' alpha isoform n=1 Tax=Astathelohania contejeani TaxID=164912 RepID=A0ABQ7I2T4_9MICR|nr:Serine/threonine protein phosphatase 2A 57 kDa regulatory subunit B' alpha isoform [Thelohania contejeani]
MKRKINKKDDLKHNTERQGKGNNEKIATNNLMNMFETEKFKWHNKETENAIKINSDIKGGFSTNKIRRSASIYEEEPQGHMKNILIDNKYKVRQSTEEMYILSEIKKSEECNLPSLINNMINTSIFGFKTEKLILIYLKKNAIILHRPSNIPSGKIFSPEDDRDVELKERTKIKNALKTFEFYIKRNKIDIVAFKQIITLNSISNLVLQLSTDDFVERNYIFIILKKTYENINLYRNTIEMSIINEIIKYIEGERSHVGMEECLELISFIRVLTPFANFKDANIFFINYINPLFKKNDFYLYEDALMSLFCNLSQKSQESFDLILQNIFKGFSCFNTRNRIFAMRLISRILTSFLRTESLLSILSGLTKMINCCLNSYNVFQIDIVDEFFRNSLIYKLIEENSEVFIKNIFVSLYSISKKHWKDSQKSIIFNIIRKITEINPIIFYECLKSYNLNRFRDKRQNREDCVIEELKNIRMSDISEPRSIRRKSVLPLSDQEFENIKRFKK